MLRSRHRRRLLPCLLLCFGLLWPAAASVAQETFDKDAVLAEAEKFFGETTEGLAQVVEKVFKEQGEPNAYIAGEEVSGAIGVGVRYGSGMLRFKSGPTREVFWTGPSIGFDFGGNASKVFVLVYRLNSTEQLFQRWPGVDGSAYFIGGVGVNYQRIEQTVLAPIRLGVGFRAGASVGYMNYTPKKTWNPF